MANWKQELQLEIAGIEDVNANTAVLSIKIDTLNDFFGEETKIVTITREFTVKSPNPVNVNLIDGLLYRPGDFLCQVAFLRLKDAFNTKDGDPQITINGKVKTLEETRPFTAQNNWGIDLGDDTITIGGDTWTIVGIKSDKWLDNEPAILEFTLRK